MPVITASLIIGGKTLGAYLVKKYAIKTAATGASSILRELATNPAIKEAAGKFAENVGTGIAQDLGKDTGEEVVKQVADVMEAIGEYL
ncbi:hypothetical protein QWY85_13060 [Neolewinella lacunae]|uniref:Uncharacterized protein n=1 Tax=Neolewinella lacunae TaxID=1517758 RepID=A0A923PK18_9BACT|nr:hypothetical protein [Neolewinella lacunae]MBC6995558.1 hypothetical protein [Neolewinella lacunae]MDN3635594.1 hypothetical protein [Neolewinella lacunae]